ncbi:helix-turn-helix domain-containing protein [Fulvivirga ligni]|uniref:helix-turn-helix domain-containing protein n=1 Tax=Fulvivirga ligni TaxID=2904246 RepID=UPI00278C01EF|nr:helix-turn-helix transcriptional regulator [Fulvivirga ligni]
MNHHKFNSIGEAHEVFGLPKPQHPLISLVDGSVANPANMPSGSHVLNFYKISYKPGMSTRLRYGQDYYDFNEGGLLFASPNQILGGEAESNSEVAACSLYTLLIHPDFFVGYSLASDIKRFGFFSYSTNEGLHLSEAEKDTVISIFKMIQTELSSRIDDFSQDVIISQIELLLNFANRFYNRQFITRKAVNHDILRQLDSYLDDYLDHDKSLNQGIPSVQLLADQVNLTPSYLSDMLRSLTGRNAQQLIHDKLIEKAKELLSTTNLSVAEIAYQLGFEYSQSFSRLFKTKTDVSPLEFRRSFN